MTRMRATRRRLLVAGLGGAVLWGVLPALVRDRGVVRAASDRRTWLLATADEVRPPPPSAPSRAEVDELLDLQARRDADTVATIRRWDDGPAILPWTALALDFIMRRWPSPARAARALALLHAATHDAVLAALDGQDAYRRPPPTAVEPALQPLNDVAVGGSSFPSEHAAVAGAAATVLAYLFPEQPAATLEALAEEAATSRLWAGAAYRSDIEAGLALGRAVGERGVARGRADGSDARWDGSGRLTEEGTWRPTPPSYEPSPLDPLAGTWQTWVIADVVQLRPPPPPAYNSPAWRAQLAAVQRAVSGPAGAERSRRRGCGPRSPAT